jgi:hypothetical protein
VYSVEQQARLGVDKFGRVLRAPAEAETSRGSSRWFQQQGSGPAAAATGQQQRASLSALQMLQKQIQTERIGTELAETVLARELGNLEAMEAELQWTMAEISSLDSSLFAAMGIQAAAVDRFFPEQQASPRSRGGKQTYYAHRGQPSRAVVLACASQNLVPDLNFAGAAAGTAGAAACCCMLLPLRPPPLTTSINCLTINRRPNVALPVGAHSAASESELHAMQGAGGRLEKEIPILLPSACQAARSSTIDV